MVEQPRGRSLLVFDESVTVTITPLIDPFEGSVERRSQPHHRVKVERPAVIAAGDHQEQRRRVNRAVVGGVRDAAGPGELAGTQLVQNLPGLGVTPGLISLGLKPCEHKQRATRDFRVDHQRLASTQQRVTTERGYVPRDAGRRQPIVTDRHHQRLQITHRGIDQAVKQLVVGRDLRACVNPLRVFGLEHRGRAHGCRLSCCGFGTVGCNCDP